MADTFTYTISTDFTSLTESTPNVNAFREEVDDSSIDTGSNPIVRVEMLPGTDWFQIEFTTDLGAGEETTLDGVVADHTGVPLARDAARDGQTGATVDPTADNDDTEGFFIGSQWVNTTTDVVWQCVDNSTGAAVWKAVGDVAGADWGQNGFETRTTSTLTFTDGTRTLSIQPTATDFDYWFEGEKYTTTGDTRQITDVEGVHAVYYDGATLTSVANPTTGQMDSIIRTKTLVSVIYWNTTDLDEGIYVGEERHGKSMAPDTHAYLHYTNGLVYASGLALTSISADQSGDLDAHAQFGVDSGAVSDEDIYKQISAVTSTTGLPIYYMLGSGPRWYRYTNAGFSVRTSDGTSATRLAYNEYTGGAWQLTQVTSGNYVLCHVFATTEKDNPMIAIIGQNEYTSIAAARAGADTEIRDLVLDDILFPESRPVGTLIFQTNLSYANAVNARVRTTSDGDDYVDWRNEVISRTEVTTTDHNSLTGLQGGTTNEYYHLTQAKHDAVVSGPASSTDDALARYDGTTGKVIQNSGVTLDDSNNFAADSSNLTFSTTTSGSILVDAVGSVELNSSGSTIEIGNDAVAQAINVGTGAAARTLTIGNATGATALDFNAGTGGIMLDTTSGGAISIDAIGAAINITTTTSGAIDVDGAGAVSLNSSGGAINVGNDADAQAVNVGTGAAARTITVGNATGATAVDFDSGTGAFSFDSTIAQTSSLMTLTTSGTGGDSVELFVGDSDPNGSVTGLAGSLFFRDTGTSGALYLNTSNGSGTTWTQVSTAGSVTLQVAYEAGNTITTNATEGNVTIQGTEDLVVGGSVTVNFDTTDAISLDADAASNFSVTGANLTFSTATSGEVLIDGVDGVEINSSGGAIDIGNDAVAQAINVGTGAAARTITVGNATGATALDFNAGTGGITLDTTSGGAISIDAIGAAINITTTTSGAIDVDGAGAVSLNSSGGAINVGNDADAQAVNVGTGAAARTITVGNSTGATAIVANTGTGAFTINTTNGESSSVLVLTATGTGGDSAEIFVGDSDPDGSVTGLAGSLFLRDTGTSGEVYINTSTGSGTTWTQVGTGDVVGPASATDNAIARFDGTTGKLLQNSGVTIDDSDNIANAGTFNGVTVENHSARHENGGADEISVAGLSGELADAQPVTVRKNTGADVGTRSRLNFIEGTNVTLTIADDAGGDEVDITIAASGGAGSLQSAYEGGNTITTDATNGDVTITGTEDLIVSTSDLLVDTTASISLDADAASNFTVAGANLTLSTTTSGSILVDAVGAVELNSSGSTIEIGNDAVAQAINVGTGAAARTITVGNATGATALDLNAGTGGITLDTTSGGAISVDAIGANINITTTTSGTIDVDGAGAVSINSSGGVLNLGNDAVAQAVNVGTGAAARTITVGNSTGATAIVANTGTGAFAINTTNGESASVVTLTATGTNGDSAQIFVGDSNPNGSVTGLAGSLFLRDTGSGGEVYVNTSTASGTTWTQLGTGGGGIGGSTGGTDNAVLRADGTGGSTLQNSGVLIDDSNNVTLPGSALRGVGNTEVSPTAIAAQQNNYDPTDFGTADILRVDLTGTQTITGFAAPTSTDNHRFVIRNIDSGSDVLILAHESSSSTAANRIATPSKLSLSLRPGQGALLWYDSTSSRWVVVAVFREQQAVVDNGTSGTSKTIDWRRGHIQKVQLTGNVTFTFTAPSEPGTYALRIAQDATGGRTITWPSAVKWPNGFPPTHPPGASDYCWWIATWDNTNYDGDLYGGLGGFG